MKKSLCFLAVVFIFAFFSINSEVYAAKLLFPLKVGQTITYSVTDNDGNTWEHVYFISAKPILPSMNKSYYLIEQIGGEAPGEMNDIALLRSTSTGVYLYLGFGKEVSIWQNGNVGTTWTYQIGDETVQQTIEAIETVTVPAGTFAGCLKIREDCISCDPISVDTINWIKPGFGLVKTIDYKGAEHPPIVKELK